MTQNTGEWFVANEFAQVRLTIDTTGNDPRLCIEDLSSGLTRKLDAFVLASLIKATEEQIARYMDPDLGA
jgi:hypothetical protein